MSTIFILIWVALSVFILGVFVWTTRALMEQKRAWGAFARLRGLNFTRNSFFDSASVTGRLGDHDFVLVSEERTSNDLRGRKFVTLVQFSLPGKMPGPGVMGSGEYVPFVDQMPARDVLVLPIPGVSAKTDKLDSVTPYFTPERCRVLDTLVKQKGVSVLFLFDERAAFLRLETLDPFLTKGKLDKLVDGVLPMLKVLAPS